MSRGPSDNTLDLAERGIDWDDVYGFDYSCIKEIALKEPLVDCVELRSVATQPCAIRHIDIKTVKKEDLSFKVPFELKATRNDCTCGPLADFSASLIDVPRRHPRFPRLVRHLLLVLPQAYPIQHRSPRQGELSGPQTCVCLANSCF